MAATKEHFLEALNYVVSSAPFQVKLNIQGLSYHLMMHGKVTTASGDFTLADFIYVRNNFKDVYKKVDNQWRDKADDLTEGKHEWIPTNMIPYMVENVNAKAAQWRAAMDLLRSPTQFIIYKPPAINPHYTAGKPLSEFWDLNGHVGALYHKNFPTSRIQNMGPWHDGLREILKSHLNLANGTEDFLGYVNALSAYMSNTVWDGGYNNLSIDPRTIPCDYYMDSKCSQLWGANLYEMAQTLHAGCLAWIDMFRKNGEILLTHY